MSDKEERRKWTEARREGERAQRLTNKRTGRVSTPDGEGVVISQERRMNTNGGPGTNQWRVQLDDGRIRHYSASALVEIKADGTTPRRG